MVTLTGKKAALGGKIETMNLRATPVARLYYRQEFGCDIYESIKVLTADDVTYESAVPEAVKLAWAMNKADNFAKNLSTPDYAQWLEKYKKFEFAANIQPIVREAAKGFLAVVKNGDDGGDEDPADVAYLIEAIAVRLGIDLARLNEYTNQAFLDMLEIYTESNSDEEIERIQIATPEDVDRFWRR